MAITDETFKSIEGTERFFTVNGKQLRIPARFDTFMLYRTKFRELARVYSDKAAKEYIATVHDLSTFMNEFPDIYKNNLKSVAEKAVDIFISEGIYDISVEEFMEVHIKNHNYAVKDYQVMKESIMLTARNNAQATQGLMSGIGSLFGGSNAFVQGVVEGVSEGVVEEGTKLTKEQQEELYQRIQPELLFHNVFTDYWNVVISLIEVLKASGKDIWLSDSGEVENMGTIIKSMSNPNFPQDRVLDVIFDYILKKPNEAALFKLLEEKYGLTDEIKSVFEYFIYPDFSEVAYTAEDFPKPEAKEETAPSQETPQNSQQSVGQDTSDSTQDSSKKKGFFSSLGSKLDNLNGEKMKKGLKIGAGILAGGALLGGLSGSGSNSRDSQSEWEREQERKNRKAEYERRHQEALDSQREWEAVRKANEERRRKGQPELPLPPRKWY